MTESHELPLWCMYYGTLFTDHCLHLEIPSLIQNKLWKDGYYSASSTSDGSSAVLCTDWNNTNSM